MVLLSKNKYVKSRFTANMCTTSYIFTFREYETSNFTDQCWITLSL